MQTLLVLKSFHTKSWIKSSLSGHCWLLLFFSPFFSGGEAVGTLAMPWELYGEFNKCTASFCAYLRNRERICVLFSLSSSFRLSVKVHACLCSLFFAPVNVFLGLCLAPLSLSIVSILLIFLTTYPSKHYVNLPSFSHLYCPPTYLGLSTSHCPPFPCSLLSPGLRGLFSFIYLPITSLYLLFALSDLLLYQGTLFPFSLCHICFAHLCLVLSYWLVSVAFLSLPLSMLSICPSIPCLHNSFLASTIISLFLLVSL